MKIKKYIARNMPEALHQVREDLGEGAIILNTRQLRKNSRFNLDDSPCVEVTAAFDSAAEEVAPKTANLAAQRFARSMETRLGERPTAEIPAPGVSIPMAPAPSPTKSEPDVSDVMENLRELRDALDRVERRSSIQVSLPDELKRLSGRMASMGISERVANEVLQKMLEDLARSALRDQEQVADKAASLLSEAVPKCKDIRVGKKRKVVAFFGPPGAGKTTAAAKIAAGFALKRGHRIVWVTTDDQHVGALDQSKAFAEIIGVPLEIAHTEGEIKAVLERHSDAQLVLIDPPGCGSGQTAECERQRRLFEAAGVDEVQLVIDSLTGFDHMLDLIETSDQFPERRLLFTKLDQTSRPGAIVSAAIESEIPGSYFIVGSSVPGQIEAGDFRKPIAKIVGATPTRKKPRK